MVAENEQRWEWSGILAQGTGDGVSGAEQAKQRFMKKHLQ